MWVDKNDNQGSAWPWKANDKRGHMVAGMMVGSWGALMAEHLGWKHPWLWGLLMASVAGVAKEVYDLKRGSGRAEIADALWTGIGGGAGAYITIKVRF